ncbi:MAG: hypothetical protein BWY95_02025 [Bacteroidetes bacterium ADurb.BinA104]|nr:MAG: hypothetical protein BWY95_02025 [Bacteroidetes bacterium ADurb.BinA104]
MEFSGSGTLNCEVFPTGSESFSFAASASFSKHIEILRFPQFNTARIRLGSRATNGVWTTRLLGGTNSFRIVFQDRFGIAQPTIGGNIQNDAYTVMFSGYGYLNVNVDVSSKASIAFNGCGALTLSDLWGPLNGQDSNQMAWQPTERVNLYDATPRMGRNITRQKGRRWLYNSWR